MTFDLSRSKCNVLVEGPLRNISAFSWSKSEHIGRQTEPLIERPHVIVTNIRSHLPVITGMRGGGR